MTSVVISIPDQSLTIKSTIDERSYSVSTSKLGAGEKKDSYCTPRGKHIIRAKIGENARRGEIFEARRPTGRIFTINEYKSADNDWILTRILWLSGIEVGKNRLGNVDTMQRYIYIHGIPDEFSLNCPRSKGCINMNNDDVIELFDLVDIGTSVLIY